MRRFAALIFFLLLPFAARAQNPQTQTNPDFATNAITANSIAPGYRPSINSGLIMSIGAGNAMCGSRIVYAGGTLTMTASMTNYIYMNLDTSCLPAVKLTAYTANDIQIATVVAGSSTITSFTDDRTQFINQEGGVVPRVYAGTTDTIVANDRRNLVTYSNSGAIAVTLPAQSTTGFGHNFVYSFIVNGAGTVTVTTTDTVVGGTSGTTIVAGSSVGCTVIGDGTSTYYTHCSTTNTSGSVVSSVTGGGPIGASPTSGAVVLSCTTCSIKICSQVAIAMPTALIAPGAESSAVTGTCTGLTTSDTIVCQSSVHITGVTGFAPSTSGILTIDAWPTSDTIHLSYINNTGGGITPSALTVNCGSFK